MAFREYATIGHLKTRKHRALDVAYTIGTEAANVIKVTIQLKDFEGNDLSEARAVQFYLSSASTGLDIEANAPDALAIATDGSLIKSGGDSLVAGTLISEADGDIDINITHAGADTFYVVIVDPGDGSLHVSSAVTFDATT